MSGAGTESFGYMPRSGISGSYDGSIFKFPGKWIELEIIIISEVIQTQKDKHYMLSLIGRSQLLKPMCTHVYVWMCVHMWI